MTSGIRDFMNTFISRLTVLGLNVGTQSCLAWILGPSDRGSYAICLLYATLLNLFFIVGLDVAIVYFVAAKKLSISEGIIYTFIYGGIGSIVAIVAGVIILQFPFDFLAKASLNSFKLCLILIPFNVFSLTFMQLLTSTHAFGWFAIMGVVSAFLHFVFTVLFVFAFSWGINGALFSNILADILTVIVILFFFHWKYHLQWVHPSFQRLYMVFCYGLRYYIGKISNEMNLQLGTIILAFFAGKEDIGLFAVAAALTCRVFIIPDTLNAVLIPRVAEDHIGQQELITKCVRLTIIICGLLLFALCIFARPIVAVLFSSSFLPIVPLIRILAVGILVRCVGKVFVPYLIGTNHPGFVSFSVVVAMAVNLGLIMVLLPVIGLPGAAVGMSVGYIISSLLLMYGFMKYGDMDLRRVWLFQRSDWLQLIDSLCQVRKKINV